MTFQWPGGVSDSGPSAQNSASTRVKSPRSTTFGSYGAPVAGLTSRPSPSFVPSVLSPSAPGPMSIVTPSVASSSVERRITSTAPSRKAASVAGSPRSGGGPGSIGVPASEAGRANDVTWPQCGPMKTWTLPGIGRPFWAICFASERGCQRFGSRMTVPGSATSSGGFAGWCDMST